MDSLSSSCLDICLDICLFVFLFQGASDAFSEPIQGLVRSAERQDIRELTAGFRRGAASLTEHTVGGMAMSASLIASTLGAAGSNLALDQEYKLRRAERRANNAKLQVTFLLVMARANVVCCCCCCL